MVRCQNGSQVKRPVQLDLQYDVAGGVPKLNVVHMSVLLGLMAMASAGF